MKIKLLVRHSTTHKDAVIAGKKGDILDLPDGVAKHLLAIKHAVELTAEEAEAIKKGVKSGKGGKGGAGEEGDEGDK